MLNDDDTQKELNLWRKLPPPEETPPLRCMPRTYLKQCGLIRLFWAFGLNGDSNRVLGQIAPVRMVD